MIKLRDILKEIRIDTNPLKKDQIYSYHNMLLKYTGQFKYNYVNYFQFRVIDESDNLNLSYSEHEVIKALKSGEMKKQNV